MHPDPATTHGANRPSAKVITVVLVALAATALLLATTATSQATHGIHAEPLTDRHDFSDDVSVQVKLKPDGRHRDVLNVRDATNLAVLEITVPPGESFPWHTHPAPVLAAVTTGELVYRYADDCVARTYPAGTAFVDPGGDNVHTAHNTSDEDAVVIATFVGAPDDGPLTIPVDDSQQAELDERCSHTSP